jgi:hypothetical protein
LPLRAVQLPVLGLAAEARRALGDQAMAGTSRNGKEGGVNELSLLQSASHALRSYQYGNGSADLAKEVADTIDAFLSSLTTTFLISPDGKSITCHVCGMTSCNANDVLNKFCGRCHVFHEDSARAQQA